jgi:hypothetical protein
MYKQQKRAGANSNDDPRPYIKDLLNNIQNEEHNARRQNMEDRAEGTVAEGYHSNDQVAKVIQYYHTRTLNHGDHLRAALSFLLSHFMLFRGESIRRLELGDLQMVNLENEGIRPNMDCPALLAIMRQGKTNKHNRLETVGCMRNIRVEICPIMALGMYFFWRFHIDNEPFPDLVASKNWYPIKVFKFGDTIGTKWSYNSHNGSVKSALAYANIKSKKTTHINRGSSARMADILGVREAQIQRQGGWNNTTMIGAYLTGLPVELMRMMAGFPNTNRSFYLARATVDPPPTLCAQIFPEADMWNDRLMAKYQNPDNDDPIEATVAAGIFVDLMIMLRKSFLQDSVFMMQIQPAHPIWQHAIFSDPTYLEFKR